MKLFLSICFLPLLPLLYVFLRNEAKPKNNLILSTTLPKEAWEDERVSAVVAQFRFRLTLTFLLLLLAYLPALFLPHVSVCLTWMLAWLFLLIVAPYFSYCSGVKKMRALKRQHWSPSQAATVQVTDLKVLPAAFRTIPSAFFALPFLVSLVPMLFPLVQPMESYRSLYLICGTNTTVIACCYAAYRFLYRKRPDMINADTKVSAALTRIRRHHWGRFWLILAWLCALYSYTGLFLDRPATVFLFATTVFCVLTLWTAACAEYAVRKAQQRLNATQDSVILNDEDDHWLYGAVYCNPNDASLLVNNRVGLGSTVNFAHPAGKALILLSALLTLSLPFLGIPLMREEFTNVRISATDTSVQAYHTKLQYEIPFDAITDCALLTELPACSRNWGTDMEHVYKGSFSVRGVASNAKLCLDPRAPLFLLLRTEKDVYLLGMSETDGDPSAGEILLEIYRNVLVYLAEP